VKTATNEYGALEERYEYDAFGKPYKGDFTTGVGLGYTGKPYDTVTGLYNYGYRDYAPEVARFTTVDPVRDGANWFVYVNNDPVNYIDPVGLSASDVQPTYFNQTNWGNSFGQGFANGACAATSLINEVSEEYTTQTGAAMTGSQGTAAMQAAVNSGNISANGANVNNWAGAANDMWGTTGQTGTWAYNEQGEHQIYAIDRNNDPTYPEHFVNSNGEGTYHDPWNGNTGQVDDLTLQAGRETRGLDFNL
jgi:RHS repeat-associated protein